MLSPAPIVVIAAPTVSVSLEVMLILPPIATDAAAMFKAPVFEIYVSAATVLKERLPICVSRALAVTPMLSASSMLSEVPVISIMLSPAVSVSVIAPLAVSVIAVPLIVPTTMASASMSTAPPAFALVTVRPSVSSM